jgi:hypothetical protein
MNRRQWLICKKPETMLQFLQDRMTHRKLRLFICGYCRRIWPLLNEKSQKVVEAGERFADSEISNKDRAALHKASEMSVPINLAGSALVDNRWLSKQVAAFLKHSTVFAGFRAAFQADPNGGLNAIIASKPLQGDERGAQCDLLRDLFAPFHTATIDRVLLPWNSGTIPKLAQVIYAERCFGDLPILADALEEAGCTDAAILDHCRSGGEHVRGCWVVDLILGKS